MFENKKANHNILNLSTVVTAGALNPLPEGYLVKFSDGSPAAYTDNVLRGITVSPSYNMADGGEHVSLCVMGITEALISPDTLQIIFGSGLELNPVDNKLYKAITTPNLTDVIALENVEAGYDGVIKVLIIPNGYFAP